MHSQNGNSAYFFCIVFEFADAPAKKSPISLYIKTFGDASVSLFSHVQPDKGLTALTLAPGSVGRIFVPEAQQSFQTKFQVTGTER